MAVTLSTNTASIGAQRYVKTHTDAERASVEKLSSGSRINRAADDAAGLAISERLKSEYRSGRQAIRNIQDGVSMIQVGEGAMSSIGDILTRLRELSIQSASDTIGNGERTLVDKEVNQLVAEVDRIAAAAEYNGHKLLDTGPQYYAVQAGIRNDPDLDRLYYDAWIGNSTAGRLGLSGMSVATKSGAQNNLEVIDGAIERMSKNRASLGALQNRMSSAVSNGEIAAENMAASNSRIRDTDFAEASADATKNRILAMGSIAVLSQANQSGNIALKLLSG